MFCVMRTRNTIGLTMYITRVTKPSSLAFNTVLNYVNRHIVKQRTRLTNQSYPVSIFNGRASIVQCPCAIPRNN